MPVLRRHEHRGNGRSVGHLAGDGQARMDDRARLVEPRAAAMSDTRADRTPMSTDRWERVQDVFAAAVECDHSTRAELIEARCGGDQDLKHEVESLVASHEGLGPIDRLASAVAPAAAWARTRVAGWEGRSVGQYSVLELVDAGGMGI